MLEFKDERGDRVYINPKLVAAVRTNFEDGESRVTFAAGGFITLDDKDGKKAEEIKSWLEYS